MLHVGDRKVELIVSIFEVFVTALNLRIHRPKIDFSRLAWLVYPTLIKLQPPSIIEIHCKASTLLIASSYLSAIGILPRLLAAKTTTIEDSDIGRGSHLDETHQTDSTARLGPYPILPLQQTWHLFLSPLPAQTLAEGINLHPYPKLGTRVLTANLAASAMHRSQSSTAPLGARSRLITMAQAWTKMERDIR